MQNKRLFLSLSEADVNRLDSLREPLGMNRSQYIRHVINGQKKIVPPAIGSKELIDVLSKINMHLSVIALKDAVSEEDMLVVYSEIDRIKDLLGYQVTCSPVDHKLEGQA